MPFYAKIIAGLVVAAAIGCGVASTSSKTVDVSEYAPVVNAETASSESKVMQTAVFAGGCFWGVEAVFENVKGVKDVKSGYAGGDAKTAKYDVVSGGQTEHAEAVLVKYDPTKVTYIQLLTIFFSVAHDPTQLNRQGPDTGPQYRSAIFYANDDQKAKATEFIQAIDSSKALAKPIVTQVVPLKQFFDAEAYHQDYLVRNPDQPYIVIHDKPKLEDLKKRFPDLYSGKKS
ncbi:MAG: peptide-methionine (S)-S-oxide reductase MsrA [Pyrinomonadaceae bacterium]